MSASKRKRACRRSCRKNGDVEGEEQLKKIRARGPAKSTALILCKTSLDTVPPQKKGEKGGCG